MSRKWHGQFLLCRRQRKMVKTYVRGPPALLRPPPSLLESTRSAAAAAAAARRKKRASERLHFLFERAGVKIAAHHS